jgi:farnesyl diphosphate synthase
MNKMKTGDLFAFCTATGAILAGKESEIAKWKEIGYDFGSIFQIADDILDFEEDTQNKTQQEIEKNFIVQLGGIELAKKHLILQNKDLQQKIGDISSHLQIMATLVDYVFKRVC